MRVAEIDETPRGDETPRSCAIRLARAKAAAASPAATEVVLAADTVVALGRRILGKPADATDATDFLRLLSGRRHRVTTAVAVASSGAVRSRAVETIVRFRRLHPDEIDAYVSSGEWRGKAGGYAIQSRAGAFVTWISGSYSAVVGLPLAETAGMLRAAGISL